MQRPLFEWSLTTGLRRRLPTPSDMVTGTDAPRHALAHIQAAELYALYLFKDFSEHLKDALLLRMLRDLSEEFTHHQSTLFMVSFAALPESAQRLAIPFDVRWPGPDELEQVIRETFRDAVRFHSVIAEITQRDMDMMVQALRGLTRAEATRVVASALWD